MTGWKPIDTAPRDRDSRTSIYLIDKKGEVHVSFWSLCDNDFGGGRFAWAMAPRDFVPTHWMSMDDAKAILAMHLLHPPVSPWRHGRRVENNIYVGEKIAGQMHYPEMAKIAVRAVNTIDTYKRGLEVASKRIDDLLRQNETLQRRLDEARAGRDRSYHLTPNFTIGETFLIESRREEPDGSVKVVLVSKAPTG